MNSEWQAFLESQGAEIKQNQVISFANPLDKPNQLCDLSHWGLLEVRGEDATSFLQGQLTNDINLVSDTQHQLSGYCNPKGRMLANFRIIQQQQNYYLFFPKELVAKVSKKLQMYVLRSKVTIEDVSDHWIKLGLFGSTANQLLAAQLATSLPTNTNQAIIINNIHVLTIAPNRYLLLGRLNAMQTLWQQLSKQVSFAGQYSWETQDIYQGIPTIYATTSEEFIPQMTNMQDLNGISLTKGCYTGQEIVARMHYLGKLKRKMYLAFLNTDVLPQAGDDVYAQEKKVGKIVNACPLAEGGTIALAVINIEHQDQDTIYLNNNGKTVLEFKDL